MFRIMIAAAAAMLLAGCATTAKIGEVRYKTITVTKRGPCPDPATYARLKASRPTPLRHQARPANGVERTARSVAQLGLYEREGGWADQVSSTLDRCQRVSDEREESEGVASPR